MVPTESQALLQKMLQKPFFVALRTSQDLSKVPALLEEHLLWAIGAERRGELFASGPFVDGTSPPGALGGMSILRASSLEEAQQILNGDPFIREGAFSVSIKKWMLMEGGLTLTVRFSDQSYILR